MTESAPISVNLNDGYGSVRMKRHVNTGSYENAELEVILPCPVDMVGVTIEGLFKIMEDFQKEARKRFAGRFAGRFMYPNQDDEEEEEEE